MAREKKATVEAVARELMRQDGFEFYGDSLVDDAKAGSAGLFVNPRAARWVKNARAILAVVRAADAN